MTALLSPWALAGEIAEAVASGAVSAAAVAEATLARIEAVNPRINAFTDVTRDRHWPRRERSTPPAPKGIRWARSRVFPLPSRTSST